MRTKVKALEWREHTEDRGDGHSDATGDWSAYTAFGTYVVELYFHSDGVQWSFDVMFNGVTIADHDDPDAAKAAAQSHFDAAIASVLEDDWQTMAAKDVLAERRRQVEAEGWSPEHDDQHTRGELARAAASYAVGGGLFKVNAMQVPQQVWPYRWEYNPSDDERRNLVKAGALILAEIERLDRLPSPPKAGE